MAKIRSIHIPLVPGVAVNQQIRGGISFRFTADRMQALVVALENGIDEILRLSQDLGPEDDMAPPPPVAPTITSVPSGAPKGPVKNKLPLTIQEVQAAALELAARATRQHGIQAPTTLRAKSAEAKAMENAQPPGETPIVQRRRVRTITRPSMPQFEAPEASIPEDKNRGAGTEAGPAARLVTVTNGKNHIIEQGEAAPIETTIPSSETILVREGFEPDGVEELGPPPERISEGGSV